MNTSINPFASQLKMVVHSHPRAIQIGSCFFNVPDLHRYNEKRFTRKDLILKLNNITIEYPEKQNSQQYEILGNQACFRHLGARFNDRFQKVSYALWVGEDWQLIHRFCRAGKHISNDLVFRFHHFRPFIELAVSNNEQHLIPAVLYFGKPVSELKSELGSSIWKHICKSTASRNIALFKILGIFDGGNISDTHTDYKTAEIESALPQKTVPILRRLIDFPTGILNNYYFYQELSTGEETLAELTLSHSTEIQGKRRHRVFALQLDIFKILVRTAIAERKVTNNNFIAKSYRIVTDTLQLADGLNEKFCLTWSLGRFYREHQRLTKLLRARQLESYSKTRFTFSRPWHESLQWADVTIRLLASPYDLALEGFEMNHCLASYIDLVFNQRSVIFSLRNSSGYRSTLQLSVARSNRLEIRQHQAINNWDIENDEFFLAAEYVLKIQNQVSPSLKKTDAEEFFYMDFS